MKKKIILVDMSATIIHYGHIRLLKKASKLGYVIVALTNDSDILKFKGYKPEIQYKYRKEVLLSIEYIDKVVESPLFIDQKFLDKHNADFLVHGDDNANLVTNDKLIIFKRTRDISSNMIRKKASKNIKLIKKRLFV